LAVGSNHCFFKLLRAFFAFPLFFDFPFGIGADCDVEDAGRGAGRGGKAAGRPREGRPSASSSSEKSFDTGVRLAAEPTGVEAISTTLPFDTGRVSCEKPFEPGDVGWSLGATTGAEYVGAG
jgi:hypothetical protein